MTRSRRSLRAVALVLGTAVAVTAAPAVARTMVQFARNAGHVDGFSAVGARASASERAGRLVATDTHGYLPNDIIQQAPDSKALGSVPASAYEQICGEGTIAGY